MRLIDRDEILNRIGAIVSKFPEEYDEKTYKMIRCEIRNKNREVKAIPIEWIKEYTKTMLDKRAIFQIEVMIERWEAKSGVDK